MYSNYANSFLLICYVFFDGASIGSSTPSVCAMPIKEKGGHDFLVDECHVYLAPSSINGAGMGVYVTRSYSKGEVIMSSDYGNIIPIIDPYQHPNHWKWTSLFNNYVWAQPTGASNELKYEAEHTIDIQLGLGAFPNSHSYLQNLAFEFSNVTYDSTFSDEENIGSGAFSHHKGRAFVALRDIEEGEELFLNYGDGFLDSRTNLSHVPRKEDFLTATNLIKKIKPELDQMLAYFVSMEKENTIADIKELKEVTIGRILSVACRSLQSHSSSRERVASLVPKSLDKMQRLLSLSVDISHRFDEETNPLTFALAKTTVESRDKEWILKNGVCFDSIYTAKSSLPLAGDGAISKRFVQKDGIISPLPLLQIIDQNYLATYQAHMSNGRIAHDLNKKVGTQLLINYCFGHKSSTLLLCPTTNAIFVNHCSKNDTSGCAPNAMFRWSNDAKTQIWLGNSLEEIARETSWVLSFDLVATRDIQPGEEIIVDYGTGWEEAWNNHIKEWGKHDLNSSDDSKINKAAREMNNQNITFDILENKRWSNEIFTACLFWEDDQDDLIEFNNIDMNDWSKLSDLDVLSHFAQDGSKFLDYGGIKSYWPCVVISTDLHVGEYSKSNKEPSQASYMVRIFPPHWEATGKNAEHLPPRFLTNYPRSSISFFTKPYKSDLHLPKAFRHYIEIPDEIFPQQWMNRKSRKHNYNQSEDEFQVGDRIEVDFQNSGTWYVGKITGKNIDESTLYEVEFEDGNFQRSVPPQDIRRVGDILYAASPHPLF